MRTLSLGSIKALPLIFALALLFGCGASGNSTGPTISWELAEEAFVVGRAVRLEVRRSWPESWAAEPFESVRFSPLVLRPLEVRERSVGGRVVETRSFAAYALEPGTFEVPAVRFEVRPPDSEEAVEARAEAASFEARSALRSADDLAVEWPEALLGPPPEPFPWRASAWWLAVAIGLGASGYGLMRLRSRRARRGTPEAPRDWRAEIHSLEEDLDRSSSPEERRAFARRCSRALREHAAARLGPRLLSHSVAELRVRFAASAPGDPTAWGAFEPLLRATEEAKWAAGETAPEEARGWLKRWRSLVEEERAGDESASSQASSVSLEGPSS